MLAILFYLGGEPFILETREALAGVPPDLNVCVASRRIPKLRRSFLAILDKN